MICAAIQPPSLYKDIKDTCGSSPNSVSGSNASCLTLALALGPSALQSLVQDGKDGGTGENHLKAMGRILPILEAL